MNRLETIIYYVENVEKTMDFFEKAFSIKKSFIDPSGIYGQMETGATSLGFASIELAKKNLPEEFLKVSKSHLPGFEISFTATDVEESLKLALDAGAELIAPMEFKPWGQTVAYVRDFNGILVEIASEMSSVES